MLGYFIAIDAVIRELYPERRIVELTCGPTRRHPCPGPAPLKRHCESVSVDFIVKKGGEWFKAGDTAASTLSLEFTVTFTLFQTDPLYVMGLPVKGGTLVNFYADPGGPWTNARPLASGASLPGVVEFSANERTWSLAAQKSDTRPRHAFGISEWATGQHSFWEEALQRHDDLAARVARGAPPPHRAVAVPPREGLGHGESSGTCKCPEGGAACECGSPPGTP